MTDIGDGRHLETTVTLTQKIQTDQGTNTVSTRYQLKMHYFCVRINKGGEMSETPDWKFDTVRETSTTHATISQENEENLSNGPLNGLVPTERISNPSTIVINLLFYCLLVL